MKDFFKITFASMLGIILASIFFAILGIVFLTGMIASSFTETTVKENSIFALKLEGTLTEHVQESPFNLLEALMGEDHQVYGLNDILSSIQKAKYNPYIKCIYLQTGMIDAPYASFEEIRNALIDFKSSGKPIIAYADQYTQGMYYLASVADKIIINPQGSIMWHGLASETIFYKDLLKKVGIDMQIFKVGTYKSAVEPYIATEMSEANRQQVSAVIQSNWDYLLKNVSASRGIPADILNKYADEYMDLKQADEYIACGLADTLLYKDGVLNYLKELSGCDTETNLSILSLEDMTNLIAHEPLMNEQSTIAVYYANGAIDDNLSPEEGINSGKVIRDLRELRKDESVKAIVLRVNSPGGSAYGSEQIWREVTLLKEVKPVIVSMGDYAASGGYYISCAADCIVANPTTLTGSIGIFGMIPNAEGLLTDKLGLHFDVVKTNSLADMGNFTRPLNTTEKQLIQNYVAQGYRLFVKRCADGRGMSTEAIEKVAEGRVWTGTAAKELGLVDELGGLDKAIEIAAQKAEITSYKVNDYPVQDFWTVLLNDGKDSYIEGKMSETLGDFYHYSKLIQNMKNAYPVQARLPFDLRIK